MATTEGMPKYPRLHAADSYSGRIPAYPADFAAAEAQWQVEESSRAMSEGRGAFSDAWGEHSEEAPGGAKCTIAVSSRAHESKNRCWRTQTTFVFGAGQPVLSPQELSDLQVPTARLPGVAAQLALAHTNGPSLIDGRGVLLWEPGEVGAADEATGDGRPIVNGAAALLLLPLLPLLVLTSRLQCLSTPGSASYTSRERSSRRTGSGWSRRRAAS